VLISVAGKSPVIQPVYGFLFGTSVLLWAWETWWVPLLIIFGVWRHTYHKHTVRYEPTMWSMAFVLGMYSAGTWDISHLLNMATLEYLSAVFFLVAVAA
jgi:tellurite resistance protein TehA-like permease